LVRDGYCRFFRPKAPEREIVLVSRLATVVLAVAGIALTPLLTSITQAWEFLALLLAGSGVIGVVRWFWWRANAWTELSAMAAGLGCALGNIALSALAPRTEFFGLAWAEWRFELKLALFTAIALAISAAVTFLTRPVARERLLAFHAKARPGGFWGAISREAAPRDRPDVLTWGTLLDILGGVALCLGATVGIGYSLLLKPGPAAIGFAVALAGAVSVFRWFRQQDQRVNSTPSSP
jgi:hypothetical protein